MKKILIFIVSITLAETLLAANVDTQVDQCLLQQIKTAPPNVTIGEIRESCQLKAKYVVAEPVAGTIDETAATESPFGQRLASENLSEANNFELTAYKPNYLLFATYNSNINDEVWAGVYPESEMDKVEAKFQISFKARIAKGVLGGELWGAYTQKSWWQLYNADASAPFRETNYEPEIYMRWQSKADYFGFEDPLFRLGFNHQSNGRGQELSRSWNRIIGSAVFGKDNYIVSARVWYRIPEDESNDDNPDIIDYMGYGDLGVAYKYDQQIFTMNLKNNLQSDNKGAIQLDWTFPLTEKFRGYVQYYNGYGESLIDYDETTNRIGIGILLNDWL